MMMLIHRIWMGVRGRGRPNRVDDATMESVAMLVVSWNRRKFLMLL